MAATCNRGDGRKQGCRHVHQVELPDSGTVGDVDADGPPEGGGKPTVEDQIVSTVQRGTADVTPSLTLFDDLIFEQQVSCVDPRLGEEPADLVTDM